MTNFCFEIRASSDFAEVKVPVQKWTLNRLRLNFGSCYDRVICLYPRTILFCFSEQGCTNRYQTILNCNKLRARHNKHIIGAYAIIPVISRYLNADRLHLYNLLL